MSGSACAGACAGAGAGRACPGPTKCSRRRRKADEELKTATEGAVMSFGQATRAQDNALCLTSCRTFW
jgi:hypothetical protein